MASSSGAAPGSTDRVAEGAEDKQPQQVARCHVSGATAPVNGQATRPFAKAAGAAEASEGDLAFTAVPEDKCPFGFGPAAADDAQKGTADQPAAPVCPMGFGSAKARDPAAALTCTRCSGLFYEAVRTPCGHFFCRACLPPGSDCLMCGADVEGSTDEPKLQELVDAFIRLHGDLSAFEAEAGLPSGMLTGKDAAKPAAAEVTADASTARAEGTAGPEKEDAGDGAAFLLNTAMRSMAGGNIAAARQRFGLCKDELAAQAAQSGYTPELTRQLGEVCGSQGTCSQQMGDAEAAAASYHESIAHLQHSPLTSEEVTHSLTVSHNKLGDLHYAQGNLKQAQSCYSEALGIRQKAYDEGRSSGGEQGRPDLALSLVTSLLKSADIDEAMGDREAAAASQEAAAHILAEVAGRIAPGSAADAKRRALQQFLDAKLAAAA